MDEMQIEKGLKACQFSQLKQQSQLGFDEVHGAGQGRIERPWIENLTRAFSRPGNLKEAAFSIIRIDFLVENFMSLHCDLVFFIVYIKVHVSIQERNSNRNDF